MIVLWTLREGSTSCHLPLPNIWEGVNLAASYSPLPITTCVRSSFQEGTSKLPSISPLQTLTTVDNRSDWQEMIGFIWTLWTNCPISSQLYSQFACNYTISIEDNSERRQVAFLPFTTWKQFSLDRWLYVIGSWLVFDQSVYPLFYFV